VPTTYHRSDPFAEFGLRAVAHWSRLNGSAVKRVDIDPEYSKRGIDLTVEKDGSEIEVKVRTDAYFGRNPSAIENQDFPFYRRRADDFALETISHHLTREPGWMFSSNADRLWYYQACLLNTRDDLERALELSDAEMIDALNIEDDRLRIVDMKRLRQWFDEAHVEYPPRPVQTGDHLGWFRIIPDADISVNAGPVETVGRLFGSS
jgi:hypothetical protein